MVTKDVDSNGNNAGPRENLIFLQLSDKLKDAKIATKFVVKTSNGKRGTSGFIELRRSTTSCKRKTLISDVYDNDWIKTLRPIHYQSQRKGNF